MVEIANHAFAPDPQTPKSVVCSVCKLIKDHQIHRPTDPIVRGTIRPNKVG